MPEREVSRAVEASSQRIPPFRMAENIWFVGGRAVSCHVIDTGDGLIMIDTGYPFMAEQILASMREVGLDPADLRILLHSHGHYDHIGNTRRFRALTGARAYISRIDNDICNGRLDLSWAEELGYPRLEPFDCDVLLDDGDIVALGNTRIRCRLAPGHTAGTLALFVDTLSHDRAVTCAMHGGVGTNSMARDFLERRGLSLDCREQFREGLHRLAEEKVDLVLGNHPDQNDTEGKLARVRAGEADACFDPGEWRRFLAACEARLDRMLAEEAAEPKQ